MSSVERTRLGGGFWRLLAASGFSNLADGIVKVALPLVAIQFTQSPVLVAGLTVALSLPWLLFALPAGALADRLDRRRAMLVSNTIRTVLLAALVSALLLDLDSIWLLYGVAFGVGLAETMYDICAQSILPQVVRRDQLSMANGRLYAVELTANEFVGPALGGVLVTAGAVVAFSSPLGLWAVAVVALAMLRGRFRVVRSQRTRVRTDIAQGLRFLLRHRILRTLAVMTGVYNFATSAVLAVFVLYAVGPASAMHLPESAYGLLLAASAAGGLVGSFVAERVERRLGRARSLAAAIVAGSLALGVPAATVNPFVIGAAFFAGGVGIVLWNVVVVSLRQRITPDELLGRVNSGYRLLAWGLTPLGAATGGLLAQGFNLPAVFATMALVILSLLAFLAIVTETALGAADEGRTDLS